LKWPLSPAPVIALKSGLDRHKEAFCAEQQMDEDGRIGLYGHCTADRMGHGIHISSPGASPGGGCAWLA
jgi:hypothetical protein